MVYRVLPHVRSTFVTLWCHPPSSWEGICTSWRPVKPLPVEIGLSDGAYWHRSHRDIRLFSVPYQTSSIPSDSEIVVLTPVNPDRQMYYHTSTNPISCSFIYFLPVVETWRSYLNSRHRSSWNLGEGDENPLSDICTVYHGMDFRSGNTVRVSENLEVL